MSDPIYRVHNPRQPKICYCCFCCRIVSLDVIRAWQSHERKPRWFRWLWSYV